MVALAEDFGLEFLPPDVSMADYPQRQTDGLRPVIRKRGEGELLKVVGIRICVKIVAGESGGYFSLFETLDPPKVGPPLHIHRTEEETVFVLEGEYVVRTADDDRPAPAGTLCHWPSGVPHTYANAGNAPGRLLILTTSGGLEAFLRDADASGAGPGDSATLARVAALHRLDIVGPPIFT
jgi:mannose-6-phosphate isomerase-like protein (cupin superfamily)